MIVLGWSFKLLFVGWPRPIWRRCANSEALGPWPHLLPWWISTCNLSLCCCWYCPPSRCCSLFDFPLLRPTSTPPALTSITSATFLFARGKSLPFWIPWIFCPCPYWPLRHLWNILNFCSNRKGQLYVLTEPWQEESRHCFLFTSGRNSFNATK